MVRGRFITIEGGEGVGKSSFSRALVDSLRSQGQDVVQTREPGGTPVADQIRSIFVSPPNDELLTPGAELCLVSAARAQHVEHVVRPALQRGAWVVCDRYADSTRVYQGLLGRVPTETLEAVIRFTTGELMPDLTFVLDCDVSISLARLKRRLPGQDQSDVSRFDLATVQTHERLRQAFQLLAELYPQRVMLIDASGSTQDAVHCALACLRERWS